MPQPFIELGGDPDALPLHIAIANGFPPQTYIPSLRPLMTDYRVFCLPPRALWGDQTPPDTYQDWMTLADDLLAGLDAHRIEDVTAVGHSFGAIASLLAVIKEPERFTTLILLDPTILLPNLLDMTRQAWEQDAIEHHPMVQLAMRRRDTFDSKDDAFERFRGKRLFNDWSDEVLRYYVDYGTQPTADGNGMTLTWTREWEAYYFSTVHLSIWDDLPELDGLVPTLIVRGGESDTFVAESLEKVQRLLPSATYKEIDGHGHLFPQSAPEKTLTMMTTWLNQQS